MTLTPLNAIRERAERARKLVEAATPGPWAWESVGEKENYWCLGFTDPPVSGEIIEKYDEKTDTYEEKPIVAEMVCEDPSGNFRNAEFIAASPTLVRELLDTQERLIAALELAVEQRDTMYGDPPAYPEIVEPERSAFDAALAAILEPKVTP